MSSDTRSASELRPVRITRRFTDAPAGSVLWEQGKTILLCTASVQAETPPWFGDDRPGGWVTAEYVMLPGSTPQRKAWPRIGHTDSRGTEIQRLIGRALRSAVDLSRIGPHSITIDCQVLQADGGTRTAAICGGYVALVDAIRSLPAEFPAPKMRGGAVAGGAAVPPRYDPAFYRPAEAMVDELAAVSVGIIDGKLALDLDYALDSRAQVDLNVALTGRGQFVEVQGSGENGGSFDRQQLDQMLDMATMGCRRLMEQQRAALKAD